MQRNSAEHTDHSVAGAPPPAFGAATGNGAGPQPAAAAAASRQERHEAFRRMHRSKSLGASMAKFMLNLGDGAATTPTQEIEMPRRSQSPPASPPSSSVQHHSHATKGPGFFRGLMHKRKATETPQQSSGPPSSSSSDASDRSPSPQPPPHPTTPPGGVQTAMPDRHEVASRLSRKIDSRPSKEQLEEKGIMKNSKVSPLLAAKRVLLEAAKTKDQMKLNLAYRNKREAVLSIVADAEADPDFVASTGVLNAKRNAAVTNSMRHHTRPIFGMSLRELRSLYPDMRGGIPDSLWDCRARVLTELEAEGIFRVPGCFARVQMLRDDVEEARPIDWPSQDVHVVCSLIGFFFRQLPDPLVPDSAYEGLIAIGKQYDTNPESAEARAAVIAVCSKIPAHSLQVLRWFLLLLKDVVSRAEQNRMHLENVGVVFGPSLLRSSASEVEALKNIRSQNAAVKVMVQHADALPDPAEDDALKAATQNSAEAVAEAESQASRVEEHASSASPDKTEDVPVSEEERAEQRRSAPPTKRAPPVPPTKQQTASQQKDDQKAPAKPLPVLPSAPAPPAPPVPGLPPPPAMAAPTPPRPTGEQLIPQAHHTRNPSDPPPSIARKVSDGEMKHGRMQSSLDASIGRSMNMVPPGRPLPNPSRRPPSDQPQQQIKTSSPARPSSQTSSSPPLQHQQEHAQEARSGSPTAKPIAPTPPARTTSQKTIGQPAPATSPPPQAPQGKPAPAGSAQSSKQPPSSPQSSKMPPPSKSPALSPSPVAPGQAGKQQTGSATTPLPVTSSPMSPPRGRPLPDPRSSLATPKLQAPQAPVKSSELVSPTPPQRTANANASSAWQKPQRSGAQQTSQIAPALANTLATSAAGKSGIGRQRATLFVEVVDEKTALASVKMARSPGSEVIVPPGLAASAAAMATTRSTVCVTRSATKEPDLCIALYDSDPCYDTELPLRQGEIVTLASRQGEWWRGTGELTGRSGYFPANYVEVLDPTSLLLSMSRSERARIIKEKLLVR